VAGFIRRLGNERIYCLFNFSDQASYLTWYAIREQGEGAEKLTNLWTGEEFKIGQDHEHLILEPYGFMLLEPK
jgi:amylosucrase